MPTEDGTLFKKIWAAAALVDPQYHELIVKTHMDFIESGSQIISTNSYATQPNYYMSAFEKEDFMRLMCEHAKVRKIILLFWHFWNNLTKVHLLFYFLSFKYFNYPKERTILLSFNKYNIFFPESWTFCENMSWTPNFLPSFLQN